MRRFAKTLGIGAIACSMALAGAVPSFAIPMVAGSSGHQASNIVNVQLSRTEKRQIRKSYRQERRQDRREFRQEQRQDRREARFERRNDGHYYYHGHRGYRTYHRGYREYNGYWFPPAAFVAGAIIGGAATAVVSGASSSHVAWCQNHYRSYRVSDDTYQPYSGPRQRCVSP